jgi:hypothetical protein
MSDLDRETQATIDALAYRLNNRGDGDGQYATDNQLFAQEFVLAWRLRGWRPGEARAPWDYRNAHHGDGAPESEETVARLERTRRELAEIQARQHATRLRLAAEPPAGAA